MSDLTCVICGERVGFMKARHTYSDHVMCEECNCPSTLWKKIIELEEQVDDFTKRVLDIEEVLRRKFVDGEKL